MKMVLKLLVGLLVLIRKVNCQAQGGNNSFWYDIRCSKVPAAPNMRVGVMVDMKKLPFLGVVQHTFTIQGQRHVAVTTGLLVHPSYAIASAQDISKITPRKRLKNNTKLILWYSRDIKYVLEVREYIIHPEYEVVTQFTIALLRLDPRGTTGDGNNERAVLPICMPPETWKFNYKTNPYAAKMADNTYKLQKQLWKMEYYNPVLCDAFYKRNQLDFGNLLKTQRGCGRSLEYQIHGSKNCIWDKGVVFMTPDTGYWALLGMSTTLIPGCDAPTRFMRMMFYMNWMADTIQSQPEDEEEEEPIVVKQMTPTEIIMYPASTKFPKGVGQCEEDQRGRILYSDSMTIRTDNEWGRGYFFVVVSEVASFTCAEVKMVEVAAKSKTRMWVEHNCHKEIVGMAYGQGKPRDYRKAECFMYFKSTAFVEFRFIFSYDAVVELYLWGFLEVERQIPISPFLVKATTEAWWPTDNKIHWSDFGPYYTWWYNL